MWRWLICFSLLPGMGARAGSLGELRGRVELKDSREAAVRNHTDYSGVVISLTPAAAQARTLPAPKHRVILQKDKMFRPHLLAIEVGTTVEFPNADPIFHNAFSSFSGQIFDVGLYPPGSSRSVRFSRAGIARVFCNIHASMSAILVVLDTPYFAVTAADGSFALPVPPGNYALRVYHERATEGELRSLARMVAVPSGAPLLITVSEAGFLPLPHKNKHGQDYTEAADERRVYPGVRK